MKLPRLLIIFVVLGITCQCWPSGGFGGVKNHCNCSSYPAVKAQDKPVLNENFLNDNPVPSPYYDVCLLIDTFNMSLTVFSKGESIRKYPVAVGKPSSETPVGVWKVIDKSALPGTGTGTRWMRLNIPCGNFGVHGTNNPSSIGTYASGGCVRLHNIHVEEIYPWVNIGTRVIIAGNPFGRFGEDYPLLRQGSCGSAVQAVQYTLKRLGFYENEADGIFGPGTAQAVKDFRVKKGLAEGTQVDEEIYHLLGL